jgi:hypothetical protein
MTMRTMMRMRTRTSVVDVMDIINNIINNADGDDEDEDVKDVAIPSYSQLAVLLGWRQQRCESPDNNEWEETVRDLLS